MISVVTIFFNAERFIKEAIESVLAQTIDDWELVLVDDGSSDSSTAVARQYAETHAPKIRYVEHDGHANRGMSASRNLGIRHARGDCLAFLDADDVWLPDRLERGRAALLGHPRAGLVYGAAQEWWSWTGNAADGARDRVPALGVPVDTVIEPPELLLRFVRRTAPAPCVGTILVRRSVVEAVGGFEDGFRGMYEDQAFVAKVCLRTPVYASEACSMRYRQHPDSCYAVARRTGQHHAARAAFLGWLEQHVRERRAGAAVRRAVRDEIRALRPSRVRRMASAARRVAAAVARGVRAASGPPRAGRVRLGDLRRVTPVSRRWGLDRGLPVDRHYIEGFLARHASDVRGRVLEVGTDRYTRMFGGGRVSLGDILDVVSANRRATIVADLSRADAIGDATYDCVILTQVLQFVYDLRAAVATVHRILKPGGVLLATVPGISRVTDHDGIWYWQLTTASARRLLTEAFPASHVTVTAAGNVLAAVAFLHGLAAGELRADELARHDPEYEVVVMMRAAKPSG